MGRFDEQIAAAPLGDGRYRVRFDPQWRVVRGPNGGYLAAVLAQAIRAEVGDDARQLRSLTVHYPRVAAEAEADVAVTVERAGRGLTTLSVRCEQEGRVVALALAAAATPYPPSVEYVDAPMPPVPPPEEVPDPEIPDAFRELPILRHYEIRPVLGHPPLSRASQAYAGGWIRLREERPIDAPLLVAISDSWWPSPYAVTDGLIAAPTVDLTVHLRAALPRPHDWVLIEVRSRTAQEGFLEEDTRIFARDGTLLAQSRQLALAL
ncbi:MAG: thioesterase family protein [Solirubrobacteraceae bacterium]|nr:thioesterase family protein [Solirubrobacteraceae bacterium]